MQVNTKTETTSDIRSSTTTLIGHGHRQRHANDVCGWIEDAERLPLAKADPLPGRRAVCAGRSRLGDAGKPRHAFRQGRLAAPGWSAQTRHLARARRGEITTQIVLGGGSVPSFGNHGHLRHEVSTQQVDTQLEQICRGPATPDATCSFLKRYCGGGDSWHRAPRRDRIAR